MDVGSGGIAGEIPVLDRILGGTVAHAHIAAESVAAAAAVLVAELRAVPEVRTAAADAGNCHALAVDAVGMACEQGAVAVHR